MVIYFVKLGSVTPLIVSYSPWPTLMYAMVIYWPLSIIRHLALLFGRIKQVTTKVFRSACRDKIPYHSNGQLSNFSTVDISLHLHYFGKNVPAIMY